MVERLGVGPIGENAYVLSSDGGCVLVDPGDEARRILAFLDSRNLVPSCVVATHGHLDHTAAIPELFAAWEGRGKAPLLVAHSQDADYFGPRGEATNRELFAAIGALGYFNTYWIPVRSPDLLLQDGDLLPGTTIRVIHTPGHTRGSICLYSETEGFLISGDTLFENGIGRSDGPDSDAGALGRSLERLATLPASTVVYPGHGEATTIGNELVVLRRIRT